MLYNLTTKQERQLTFGQGFADIEGKYLPNGNIIFSSTRGQQTEDEYKEHLAKDNEISLTLFTGQKSITDACIIYASKDIKTCNIYFAPLSQKKKRPIIDLAAEYALNVLGMEEVFVSIKATEKTLIDSLEQSFENLGEEDGYVTYLKEKESQAVSSNFTHLH